MMRNLPRAQWGMLLVVILLTGTLPVHGATANVDPALVGTWEMPVPNAQGVARWVWEIRADGTYSFYSEGPGAVPPHTGSVTLLHGQWHLQATTGLLQWSDGGTYQLGDPNTLVATGKLGTGRWQRVAGTPASALARRVEAGQQEEPLTTAALRKRLITAGFDPAQLPKGFAFGPLVQKPVDEASRSNGVVARLESTVEGPDPRQALSVLFTIYASHEIAASTYARIASGRGEFGPAFPLLIEPARFGQLEARCLRTLSYGMFCTYLNPAVPVTIDATLADTRWNGVNEQAFRREFESRIKLVAAPMLAAARRHLVTTLGRSSF